MANPVTEQQQFIDAWNSDPENQLFEVERELQTKAKLPFQGVEYQELLAKRKQLRQTLAGQPAASVTAPPGGCSREEIPLLSNPHWGKTQPGLVLGFAFRIAVQTASAGLCASGDSAMHCARFWAARLLGAWRSLSCTQAPIYLGGQQMTEDTLLKRALAAYYRTAQKAHPWGQVMQPSNQLVQIRGKTLVHLFNVHGTLAVYELTKSRIKAVPTEHWPPALA